jgi:hypothetical protein
MRKHVTLSFWVESVVAAACFLLAVLTLVTREWIEVIFGVDPDRGSGALEWSVVGALLLVAAGLSWRARHEWRRARPQAA